MQCIVKCATGMCKGADKSLARPTYRCILFAGENISFDDSLVIYEGCPGGECARLRENVP